jgi:hypothetical protein
MPDIGRELTYSLGNSPRAKEHSNDVLPQAPRDSALQKAFRAALRRAYRRQLSQASVGATWIGSQTPQEGTGKLLTHWGLGRHCELARGDGVLKSMDGQTGQEDLGASPEQGENS